MLSVVIPALDEELHIGNCLESLQNQTRRADEIIIVDNGSLDATVEIARSLNAQVLSLPRPDLRHGDIGLVRQKGVEASMGDVIVSTDADCMYPVDWLEKIESHFDRNPRLAVLGGPAFPSNRDAWNDFVSGSGNWWRSYLAGWGIPYFLGSNTSFRKELFKQTDGYRGAAAHGPLEEWVLSFRISRVGDWVWDDSLIVYTYFPDWCRAYNAAIPLSTVPLVGWLVAALGAI